MSNENYEYEVFYNRDGFNRSLGHFQAVSDIVHTIPEKVNLADILVEDIEEGEIEQNQLSSIVYALLVDKYNYVYDTVNLRESFDDFELIQKETVKWKAVDLVGTYIHPELGFLVFNPKNLDHLKSLQTIKKNEVVNIYAGAMDKDPDKQLCLKAISLFISLLSGKKIKTPVILTKGSFSYKPLPKTQPQKSSSGKKTKTKTKTKKDSESTRPAASAEPDREESAVSSGPRRMTPLYSVPVTNELFHNGNVEAWKRIIKSYITRHPQLEVYIFYDGERIHDINALFKWGKVKHGSTILFAVAGNNVKDVAKLQRYLMQGASPRFEDFLRFPVNTVLNLF